MTIFPPPGRAQTDESSPVRGLRLDPSANHWRLEPSGAVNIEESENALSKPITDQQLAGLRARLNVTIELATQGGDKTRNDCAGRLHAQLADWEQEVKGRTTVNTLTDEQIEGLRIQMPWRHITLDAALDGNEKARACCAAWIAEEEEAAAQRQKPRQRAYG
jgi:hypothetical protein